MKMYNECNCKIWASEEIVNRWFKKIWFKFLHDDELSTDDIGYIILDKATSHKTDKIVNTYKNSDNFLAYIPTGATRYLPPLDIVINKPFKEILKKLYVEYCLENWTGNMPVIRKKIIDMITKVWWDEKL